MRVLITGAAGYVGSTLTNCLARRGHHVVAIDSDADRLRLLASLPLPEGSVEVHSRDLRDLATDWNILSSVEAAIHLAGISSDASAERDPQLAWQVNTRLAIELAKTAKATGIPRFLLASTVAIFQVPVNHKLEHAIFRENDQPPLSEPIGVYAQSKFAAEQAPIRLADPEFTVIVLRKGSLYGYSPIMRWDLIINRIRQSS